jgi:hypothetical protein
VAQGTPQQIIKATSYTAKFLAEFLRERPAGSALISV